METEKSINHEQCKETVINLWKQLALNIARENRRIMRSNYETFFIMGITTCIYAFVLINAFYGNNEVDDEND